MNDAQRDSLVATVSELNGLLAELDGRTYLASVSDDAAAGIVLVLGYSPTAPRAPSERSTDDILRGNIRDHVEALNRILSSLYPDTRIASVTVDQPEGADKPQLRLDLWEDV